jgi:hypothetical protein
MRDLARRRICRCAKWFPISSRRPANKELNGQEKL